MGEINDLGGISLSLFLGMAMITLKLWELASLALPLIILLSSQVILIAVFTYFIEFNIMGRDYDAAVLVAGTADSVWVHSKCHGKYAGSLRPLCSIRQSIPSDSTGGKSVCRFHQQSCNYIFY